MNENTNDIQKEIEAILEDDEAYGSNVNILNYSSTPTKITGKFKDSWNNRVFDFTIDEDGVGYKPSVNLDSVPVESQEGRFDSFSDGYLSGIRADGKLTGKRTKKPKCGGTSFGCGFSCVGLTKVCRITPGRKKIKGHEGANISKERISKLLERANEPGADPKFQAHYEQADRTRTLAKMSSKRRHSMREKPAEAISKAPAIDKTLFDIKFPGDKGGNELGSLIDRVFLAQDMVKGKSSYFSEATNMGKANILNDMVSEYYGENNDYDEMIKSARKSGDKDREMYATAAITRL